MLGFKAKNLSSNKLMAHLYKEPRICECGYSTLNRSRFSAHKRTCATTRSVEADGEKDQLRECVASLQAQVADKEQRIAALEQMLCHELLDVKEELRQTKRRKDRYANVAATRRPLTEPERRKIAQGQGWRCVNPDGGCLLPGELQEYDIDHVVPMGKGGKDATENMQALCPSCHRRKTSRERCERSIGTLVKVATSPES